MGAMHLIASIHHMNAFRILNDSNNAVQNYCNNNRKKNSVLFVIVRIAVEGTNGSETMKN